MSRADGHQAMATPSPPVLYNHTGVTDMDFDLYRALGAMTHNTLPGPVATPVPYNETIGLPLIQNGLHVLTCMTPNDVARELFPETIPDYVDPTLHLCPIPDLGGWDQTIEEVIKEMEMKDILWEPKQKEEDENTDMEQELEQEMRDLNLGQENRGEKEKGIPEVWQMEEVDEKYCDYENGYEYNLRAVTPARVCPVRPSTPWKMGKRKKRGRPDSEDRQSHVKVLRNSRNNRSKTDSETDYSSNSSGRSWDDMSEDDLLEKKELEEMHEAYKHKDKSATREEQLLDANAALQQSGQLVPLPKVCDRKWVIRIKRHLDDADKNWLTVAGARTLLQLARIRCYNKSRGLVAAEKLDDHINWLREVRPPRLRTKGVMRYFYGLAIDDDTRQVLCATRESKCRATETAKELAREDEKYCKDSQGYTHLSGEGNVGIFSKFPIAPPGPIALNCGEIVHTQPRCGGTGGYRTIQFVTTREIQQGLSELVTRENPQRALVSIGINSVMMKWFLLMMSFTLLVHSAQANVEATVSQINHFGDLVQLKCNSSMNFNTCTFSHNGRKCTVMRTGEFSKCNLPTMAKWLKVSSGDCKISVRVKKAQLGLWQCAMKRGNQTSQTLIFLGLGIPGKESKFVDKLGLVNFLFKNWPTNEVTRVKMDSQGAKVECGVDWFGSFVVVSFGLIYSWFLLCLVGRKDCCCTFFCC